MLYDASALAAFDLEPALADHVNPIVDACAQRGIDIRPLWGTRTPFRQAQLWRQSRPTSVVLAEIARLQKLGCPFLAHCLEVVGPQATKPEVTQAIPGLSWHQWKQALDFGWFVNGTYVGRADTFVDVRGTPVNGYRVLGSVAYARGLTHGGTAWGWDWPHVQLPTSASPRGRYTFKHIDTTMQQLFESHPDNKS